MGRLATCGSILALPFLIMGASVVYAEPIPAPCTTDSVFLSRFGPCVLGGKVFSDFHAALGGVDVTASPLLGATTTQDIGPGEVVVAPVLAIPQQLPVTPDNLLTISFRVTPLDARTSITAALVSIHPFSDFAGALAVEFLGGLTPASVVLGSDMQGNALARTAFVPLTGGGPFQVISTLNRPAPLGGAFGFSFESQDPAPVPEPATVLLFGSGIAIAARAARRRRVRMNAETGGS
jgi:hypothetical protein